MDNYLEGIHFFEKVFYQIKNLTTDPFDFDKYFHRVCDDFIAKYSKYKPFERSISDYVSEYGKSIIELYQKTVCGDDEALQGVQTIIQQSLEVKNGVDDIKDDAQELKQLNKAILEKESENNDLLKRIVQSGQVNSVGQAITQKGSEDNTGATVSNNSRPNAFVDRLYVRYRLNDKAEWERIDPKECKLSDVVNDVVNNRLIFIEGGFRTGKTYLSKVILDSLFDKGLSTQFYLSYEFIKDKTHVYPLNSYVFIDGLDAEYDLKKHDKLVTLLKDIYEKNRDSHFIINMRPYREVLFPGEPDFFADLAVAVNAKNAIKVKTVKM